MTEFQPKPQTHEEVADGLRNAFRQAIKDGVMDATPYLKQMTFKSDIEKTEAEIKVLQKKLELLKEIEKHKSPVEEAYKDWWGQYPELETDSKYDDTRWKGFRAGYHFAYEEKVKEDNYNDKSQPRMEFSFGGKFEVVSYNDEVYYRLEFPDEFYWYKKKYSDDGLLMVAITDGETCRLLEGLWFNEVKKGKYDDVVTTEPYKNVRAYWEEK
jgi:hypothetical protein